MFEKGKEEISNSHKKRMKKWLSVFLLVSGGFLLGLGVFSLKNKAKEAAEIKIISPLVDDSFQIEEFWRKFETSELIETEEFWQPEIELSKNPPTLKARAAAVVDLTSEKMILSKNIEEQLPIASLTKVMTAILALEYGDLEKEMVVSEEAAEIGEAFMGLSAGERLRLEDLLYGLLLPSGNDAAEAIAQGLAGRREVFVKAMNRQAEKMGLKKTHFVNPTGLDEDEKGVSKSTAWDLVLLSYYAWTKFPKFREIVGSKEWRIEKTEAHKAYHLENTLGLEETYPGMKGIKPGNTQAAGYCLLGLAERKGREILVVLLDSANPKEEAVRLFDWGFDKI